MIFIVIMLCASFIIAEEKETPSDIASIQTDAPVRAHEIVFTHPILKIVDGHHGAIDDKKIWGMKYMIQEIGKIQYGAIDKASQHRMGKYSHNNQLCTLKMLVKLETEHKLNSSASELLKKVKEDLGKITDPNLEEGRGSKHMMRVLIAEWAQKRHKSNSFLITWSDLPESADRDGFRKQLTSFEMVDNYCTDLAQFLGDLQRSCPKAVKLYNEKHPKH